jgi:hypothetical protein
MYLFFNDKYNLLFTISSSFIIIMHKRAYSSSSFSSTDDGGSAARSRFLLEQSYFVVDGVERSRQQVIKRVANGVTIAT